MFVIEDELHAEWIGQFSTREHAMAELRRFADLPWDQAPNRAPCTSSKTCGRSYELIEYDGSLVPWVALSRTPVLDVSASDVRWLLEER